jgi:uncharacterized membrane protein
VTRDLGTLTHARWQVHHATLSLARLDRAAKAANRAGREPLPPDAREEIHALVAALETVAGLLRVVAAAERPVEPAA